MFRALLQFLARIFGRDDGLTTPVHVEKPDLDEPSDDEIEAIPDESPEDDTNPIEVPIVPKPPLAGPAQPGDLFDTPAEPGRFDPPPTEPAPEKPKHIAVGAWVGNRDLNNPKRTIDFAREYNITRLHIIVNDHAGRWKSTKKPSFDTRPPEKIIRLADLAHKAGMEVHLMSWIMPYEDYLRQAAEQLIPLAQACRAHSVEWDAEEPWTKPQASGKMSYEAAGKLVGELFRDQGFEMGVNGIGYGSQKKIGPLAAVCEYICPQAYSTSKQHLSPKTTVPKFAKRWRKLFPGKRLVVGLAAYNQEGILRDKKDKSKGTYEKLEAVRLAIAAAKSVEDVEAVVYWSFSHLRWNKDVAREVANFNATGEGGEA
jgi:hypothetical protein